MKPLAALLALVELLPGPVRACAVCFTRTSDNTKLIRGLIWGGAVLVGSVFCLVGAIVAALARIERDRAAREAALPSVRPSLP